MITPRKSVVVDIPGIDHDPAILLQQTAAGVGGALGGSSAEGFHQTRRGFEKFLFYLSIVCGILFALFALLSIIVKAHS